MIEKEQIKSAGFNSWKDYAESIGQNPSNFKRQLIKNIEKLNKWLSPINLQIQIAPKGESGAGKRKEKA
ncbi:MAG: hypothetical protein VYB44_07260 [Bacteroidota bacterium]|nr:hypothetical protein [Bacteroidota bacterium]